MREWRLEGPGADGGAVFLFALFAVLNTMLTLFRMYLGPSFFRYGFTLSLLICVLPGLHRLTTVLAMTSLSAFFSSNKSRAGSLLQGVREVAKTSRFRV